MSERATGVEDKIVLAAIDCIEKYGITGTTTRAIAQMAGVNSAAINYYFRSKDVLIRRCMETTLRNAFDLSDVPSMPGLSARERLVAILVELIEGGCNYPGITRAHFYALLAEGQTDTLLEDRINRFVSDLAEDLRGRDGSLPGRALELALVQIVSAMIPAILAPRLFARLHGVDFNDADTRQTYVRHLVSRLMP
jgi:AcrR family transcriptional regulator